MQRTPSQNSIPRTLIPTLLVDGRALLKSPHPKHRAAQVNMDNEKYLLALASAISMLLWLFIRGLRGSLCFSGVFLKNVEAKGLRGEARCLWWVFLGCLRGPGMGGVPPNLRLSPLSPGKTERQAHPEIRDMLSVFVHQVWGVGCRACRV